jgi:hypothetical protein
LRQYSMEEVDATVPPNAYIDHSMGKADTLNPNYGQMEVSNAKSKRCTNTETMSPSERNMVMEMLCKMNK